MKIVDKRYMEFGEVFLYLLKPLINNMIPEDKRQDYRSKLINKLHKYTFVNRKKTSKAHENSVVKRKIIEIKFEDIYSPEHTAEALITALHGFYNANTQNKIKEYIGNNL